MATRVTPTPIDADNSSGNFVSAVRNDCRFGDADSMSARATQSPLKMPDIRVQAYTFLSQLSISLLPAASNGPTTRSIFETAYSKMQGIESGVT